MVEYPTLEACGLKTWPCESYNVPYLATNQFEQFGTCGLEQTLGFQISYCANTLINQCGNRADQYVLQLQVCNFSPVRKLCFRLIPVRLKALRRLFRVLEIENSGFAIPTSPSSKPLRNNPVFQTSTGAESHLFPTSWWKVMHTPSVFSINSWIGQEQPVFILTNWLAHGFLIQT